MEKKNNEFTWKIGGQAGFGIMSTGEMFARLCLRAGLQVFTYPEYPSLIRGGHNTDQVTASVNPVMAHRTAVDLLVALNRETFDRHLAELSLQGTIIYDTTDPTFAGWSPSTPKRTDITVIGLPLEELAVSGGGQMLLRNTVAFGASAALLGFPSDLLETVIRHTFQHKAPEVIALNLRLVAAGYRAITAEQQRQCADGVVPMADPEQRYLLTGNDAIALGAIAAGCQFYSAYPMTPASSILHFLAEHGPTHGLIVRQAEDELAAVNQAIGAAYAGVRAMTGTAGGGFALMTEAVGMAAMTEVGLVIIEAQRGGPSTGLPTWTEQGDLRQVLHASQGDFPRIVLAPSSHAECFSLTIEAFAMADRYQTPVIVMTDKYLAEGHRTIPDSALTRPPIDQGKIAPTGTLTPTKDFPRYRFDVADGVAPRTLPGTPGGVFLANSDEHDEFGYSAEDIPTRRAQVDRRARKFEHFFDQLSGLRCLGTDRSPLTVVTWGSSAGPVEAARVFVQESLGLDLHVVIVTVMHPFPIEQFNQTLAPATRTVIVEGNHSGQLEGLIRQYTGRTFDHHLRRDDGRPFDAVELARVFTDYLR